MEIQMLLCDQCYENVYTLRPSNYPSFKVLQVMQNFVDKEPIC
jgi:hypothetical protein